MGAALYMNLFFRVEAERFPASMTLYHMRPITRGPSVNHLKNLPVSTTWQSPVCPWGGSRATTTDPSDPSTDHNNQAPQNNKRGERPQPSSAASVGGLLAGCVGEMIMGGAGRCLPAPLTDDVILRFECHERLGGQPPDLPHHPPISTATSAQTSHLENNCVNLAVAEGEGRLDCSPTESPSCPPSVWLQGG
jgi:hypothetical protein